ncbi:prepilin-type N-terminal cleavage/methylation domain-containing protein [Undibacterium sp. Jales W-56]|uniref:PulJ/GspJ family protein n=1 Tax=Undibacterium sp. Jales W-56 TaxID=2897325 RepID=UPI0021D1CCB7|nr:prepilin-type N-terminal cleavage/methylation domain-containing protein [Undibacterium sp. Jales W-56]MCU6433141.1 prepilin-type N-terminal cleavage/methylation domain-containing protein [Undibacterium sp. Jales W-56]
MRSEKKQSGFTLIELLVAITILAIVAVLGWRGLDSIVRARIGLTNELEQSRGTQISFAQLENDCAHLAGVDLLATHESLRASQQSLFLIRTVFDDNQPLRLQVVAYRLLDGVLTRRESSATRDLKQLDADWQSALNETDAMPVVVLQNEVASIAMRTWNKDENGWRVAGTDIDSSRNTAGTTGGAGKPIPLKSGLEMSLQLRGREHAMLKVFLLGAA